ncbi:hypothetical protein Bhyg_15018 [Pseudolycoriella hygida]|uniref:Uncharacterized protein n=1 Tax=Pseudolycoriella hygida TaxID=35572 RepID=A0A9Q0RY03_9DIPT|nr:hypothetical protein Bhyg_15018 [Pseudolycoriella hygida]
MGLSLPTLKKPCRRLNGHFFLTQAQVSERLEDQFCYCESGCQDLFFNPEEVRCFPLFVPVASPQSCM